MKPTSENPELPKGALESMEAPHSDQDDAALALPILRHMHLVDIHQVKFDAIRHPVFDSKPANAKMSIHTKESINVAFNAEKRGVIALVAVGVRGMHEKVAMYEITAVYRAIYTVKDSFDGDDIEGRAKAFCRSTSLAHVWSYWREALVSASMRMALPPIVAPLLIVGAKMPARVKRA